MYIFAGRGISSGYRRRRERPALADAWQQNFVAPSPRPLRPPWLISLSSFLENLPPYILAIIPRMELELSAPPRANLFQPGYTLGGRRKGSVGGCARALMVLDAMLNEAGNLEHLREAL